MQQEREALTWT